MDETYLLYGSETFCADPFLNFMQMNMDCVLMLPDNKFTSEELLLSDTRAQEDMLPSYRLASIQIDVV